MSRKRADDVTLAAAFDVFTQLPARTGLITAVGLFVLGWILPLVFPGGQGFAGIFSQAGKTILWLLAALAAAAALIGALRRLMDRNRFDSDIRLDELTWPQFEGYLAEYFRRRGSSVTQRGGAIADGGVDLVLDDATGRRIVQAKHWKTRSVGVVPLRALWGLLGDERAQGAVVVTSGQFTADAIAFAEGKRLELIAREQLLRLINEVKNGTHASILGASRNDASVGVPPGSETCPQCRRGLLERKLAHRGRNAGSYFLGCNRFPDCRYARNT